MNQTSYSVAKYEIKIGVAPLNLCHQTSTLWAALMQLLMRQAPCSSLISPNLTKF